MYVVKTLDREWDGNGKNRKNAKVATFFQEKTGDLNRMQFRRNLQNSAKISHYYNAHAVPEHFGMVREQGTHSVAFFVITSYVLRK